MLSDLPDLHKPHLPPETALAGRCMSCKRVVQTTRARARYTGGANTGYSSRARTPDPAAWGDILVAECPACGSKVFVMELAKFAQADAAVPGRKG